MVRATFLSLPKQPSSTNTEGLTLGLLVALDPASTVAQRHAPELGGREKKRGGVVGGEV
jgi:hypothetical protein